MFYRSKVLVPTAGKKIFQFKFFFTLLHAIAIICVS